MTVKSHMLGESLLTVSYYISGVLLPGHLKFLIIFLSSQRSQFGHSSRLEDGKHRCNMAKLEGLPVEILQLISQLLPKLRHQSHREIHPFTKERTLDFSWAFVFFLSNLSQLAVN